MNIRQSPQYAKYLSEIGWKVDKISGNYYFIKKIPILGNIVKIQRPEKKISDQVIKRLREKYKPFRIILEPSMGQKTPEGFKLSKSPYLPSKTLHLDLKKSEKILCKQLKKDAKYALRKNENTNVKECKDIELFRKYWKKSVPWDRYVPSLHDLKALKENLKDNCTFLTTNDFTGGAVFVKSNDTAYYWLAFTNKTGRKKQVQYKIVWEGILWTKKMRAKIFDFEGIYDPRFPNKKWLGFTHFKKSFGGVEIEYPGAFIKKFGII